MKVRSLIIGVIFIVLLDLVLFRNYNKTEDIEKEMTTQYSSTMLEILEDGRTELLSVVPHYFTWEDKRHSEINHVFGSSFTGSHGNLVIQNMDLYRPIEIQMGLDFNSICKLDYSMFEHIRNTRYQDYKVFH